MTNAEKVRTMTDEQMAAWMNEHDFCCPPVDCKDNGCVECWLEWLQQEVDNDVR